MFKGTFKDVVTNIFAFITGFISVILLIINVWNQWLATASPKPTLIEWIQLVILIVTTLVAYFTGKDSDGKPKKVL